MDPGKVAERMEDTGTCYMCNQPIDPGGGWEAGNCVDCGRLFHYPDCDRGWTPEGSHDHICSVCAEEGGWMPGPDDYQCPDCQTWFDGDECPNCGWA